MDLINDVDFEAMQDTTANPYWISTPPPTKSSDDAAMDRLLFERRQKCFDGMLEESVPSPNDDGLYCPRTFDGWSCWNTTPAGQRASTLCPYFVTGFDPSRWAHKTCNEDGTWFRHPDSNQTWSNYTTCVDLDDLKWRQVINTLYISGYSISLVALSISLFIFFYFKTLNCARITIHKNLFAAFIVNNTMWLIWYKEIVGKPNILIENGATCQILHVVLQYFLVTSYFWMFCEGFYLHTILVAAFASEELIMNTCYVIGWGVPFFLTFLYAFLRAYQPDDTTACWIEESHYTWILAAPVGISMLTNVVFLINIVRLLVTKLRAGTSRPSTAQCPSSTRKAVRATLILIPLLGLHYLVTPFRPEYGSPMESTYEVISAVTSSFQGFCVATLFCFCNSEVSAHIRKKWRQRSIMNSNKGTAHSYTTTTMSFVKATTCQHEGGHAASSEQMV